ncbi:MAG: hypothetical protein WAL35_05385 [Acidimicrobiales bacterium]
MSLDTEGVEDLALQGRRPVNKLDVASGIQLVTADLRELGQRATRAHRLLGEIGALHAGLFEVVAHHGFDHRGDDTERNVAAHALFETAIDGAKTEKVLHHTKPPFDILEHP